MPEQHSPVPLVAVLPFALLLVAIAVLPLVAHRWWEHNRNKAVVGGLLAAPVAAWLAMRDPHALGHAAVEYVSFVVLLGSLYVVAGGIRITGDLRATPATNTCLLGAGAVLANVIGTTGASMVLIRAVLRTNSQRREVGHIPFFFILIVSNCGGLLTPLGDPPLFLGFLRGVPFTWTLRLWPVWLGVVGYLLVTFYLVDRRAYRRERPDALRRDAAEREPLGLQGLPNLALLAGVVGAVFLPTPWREAVMVTLAAVSQLAVARHVRAANEFTWTPISEVAILFAAIFVTMVPALQLLSARGGELGLTAPWQFFVVTGSLSSFLDNAPTYLTFFSVAESLGLPREVAGMPHVFLEAISVGAVLMGANTYIGNGPNFMVKAIADEQGYATGSFFRYAVVAMLTLAPAYAAICAYLVLRAGT
jgi:Na+/H+ antiporter NhaD/arsenite permease-like protein